MTSTAVSASVARSSASRTRSMPMSAGGAERGSLVVQSISLPTATRCSFTPCSRPHNHDGREPTSATAPESGIVRYWVRSCGPGPRRPNAWLICSSPAGRSEFFANSVPWVPTAARVSHTLGPPCHRQKKSLPPSTGIVAPTT